MSQQSLDNERREHPLRVLGKSLSEKEHQRSDCDDPSAWMRQTSPGPLESKQIHSDIDDIREDVSTTQACSSCMSDGWSESTSAPDISEVRSPAVAGVLPAQQPQRPHRSLSQKAMDQAIHNTPQFAAVWLGHHLFGQEVTAPPLPRKDLKLQPSTESSSQKEELQKCCPKGHVLEEFHITHDRCICDKCGNTVPRGAKLAGCRRCNYDVCRNCRKNSKIFTDRRFHAMLEEVPELPDVCPTTAIESVLFPGLQPVDPSKATRADDSQPEPSEVPSSSQVEAPVLEPSTLIEVRSSQAPDRWEHACILLVNYGEGKYKVRMADGTARWVAADAARPVQDVGKVGVHFSK
mmetsp:Transcript_100313/g.164864  ORF Transcript_100313/g.164864 Transcript_100313/m.164864 type:complete len:349 (-) Transcript_100313:63-1109(-)